MFKCIRYICFFVCHRILQVVGPERDVDREDLNQLVYTNAVIMESLRLIPAVPMLLRAVKKDVKLSKRNMLILAWCTSYTFGIAL